MKNMQFSCEFCMNFIWIWHKYLIAWKTYEKLFAWKLYIFHANIMRTYSHDICMRNFSSDFRMISAWFSCEKEIAWKLCEPLFPVYSSIFAFWIVPSTTYKEGHPLQPCQENMYYSQWWGNKKSASQRIKTIFNWPALPYQPYQRRNNEGQRNR